MGTFLNLNPKQKLFTILTVIIIVLFLSETFLPIKIFSPFQRVFLPIQVGVYKTSRDIQGFFETTVRIGSLREQNLQLEKQNALLDAENAKLKKLENENQILRKQLSVKMKNKKSILASIVGQNPLFSGSRVILDKGFEEGVREKAIVFVKDILIGTVVQVGQYSSTAILLSDPDSKIPAVTANGVSGLVQGAFGNSVIMTNIAQNQNIIEGEIVFTSGESGFPRGMVLGKINTIKSNPADLFKTAQLDPSLDLDLLETVFIATGKDE